MAVDAELGVKFKCCRLEQVEPKQVTMWSSAPGPTILAGERAASEGKPTVSMVKVQDSQDA